MLHKLAIIGSLSLILVAPVVWADQTTVSLDSGDFMLFDNPSLHMGNDVALTGGNQVVVVDGDGAVLQLGYYSQATTGNNFLGTWVPLTGQGSLNTATVPGSSPPEPYNKTSIGDVTSHFAGNATFAMSLNFVAGNAQSGNSLPAGSSTPPLAIRFYNNTTIETSTYYNVVSDDSWTWITPTNASPSKAISLNDAGLEWLSVDQGQALNTAFHTTLSLQAVPEPTTIAAGTLCAASLICRVLRRRSAA